MKANPGQAGPLVRLACERHERDCREAKQHGFYFDAQAADHAIDFIERWVRLPDTADERGQPRPFILQPWQAFIVGSLFGWKWPESGHRRYRNAYIEIGKGNGKTPLLAAIGLYGLMMDGQVAPEIYAAAADRDQAMIMFRDAVRMVEASPDLAGRIRKTGINHVTSMSYGMGFFRPFSREQGSKSGTRPHMGLIDEVHEQPAGADVVNKIRAGAKGNQDAMFLEITNSGYDRTSICYQHHEHSRRILEQTVRDDRWFAYVCTLDEGDDPLRDESCWRKVNPNLDVSIQIEYLRDQASAARNIPGETNTVLRLNFCVWTQALSREFKAQQWRACDAVVPDEELVGQPCFAGLDLGLSDDLAAFVLVWSLGDGRVVARPTFWIPKATIEAKPNRPYDVWFREGALRVTEGESTDMDAVETEVLEQCQRWGVRELAYDKRFAEQMRQHLEGEGVTCIDTPQGWGLNESILFLRTLVKDGRLCHGGDPVLAWMADNFVTRSGQRGDVRPDKPAAADKVDGVVALCMALDRVVRMPQESDYNTKELFVI